MNQTSKQSPLNKNNSKKIQAKEANLRQTFLARIEMR